MSPGTLVLVGAAGGVGALLRFAVDSGVNRQVDHPFALGTFVVNITGALLLGFVVGLAADGRLTLILSAGLLGGYSTFSTWMLETDAMAREGHLKWAALNLVGSAVVGVLAVALGRAAAGG